MTSQLIVASFDAKSAGTRVDYRVLAPSDRGEGERLPLVLHLHGAMSSAASLEAAKDAYDLAWSNGILPRAIIACASTPTLGGFYIDGGEADEFNLHDGATYLDRVLTELDVTHRFDSVRGAGHADAAAPARQAKAIAFIGEALLKAG